MPNLSSLANIPFLGGYEAARARNEEQGMNELKTASGAMGLLAAIQAQQQKREALARQEKFRQGLTALGPNATQEQLAQLAAQHVDDPAKLMDVQQKSLDRKATIEATSAQRAATLAQQREAMLGRLAQQEQSAAQIHEYRLGRLQNDTERNAEIARRNAEMETFRQRQQQVDEQFKRMGLGIQQGLLDVRRTQVAQGNKPPAGYRWTPEGGQEAIPGGPADTKRQGQLNADTATLESTTSQMNRLAAETNRLLKHPGLSKATGVMSWVPGVGGLATVPGTDAADFKAGLDTLKSQVGFSVLQAMRDAAKTGGALGQISDRENILLQNNLAALDAAQSPEEFKNALGRIITYTEEAKGRLRSAYNVKHSGRSASTEPSVPQGVDPKVWAVMTPEERALWK